MADDHIDQDETQIYGTHTVPLLRTHVVGLIAACDSAVSYFADELEHATQAVAAAVNASRDAKADYRQGAQETHTPLDSSTKLLVRFSKHLGTHAAAIDKKTYFLKDGTATGVGRGASRVLLALTHIQRELAKDECPIDNKAQWLADFTAAISDLSPALDTAAAARTHKQTLTPGVAAAYAAWLVTYRSARELVTGVLRSAGRLDLLTIVFHDLVVPAGTKVTVIPTAPAAAAKRPAVEAETEEEAEPKPQKG